MAAPGMFSQGFLSEKSVGGLPNWSLGVGAVAVLVLWKTWQKNRAESISGTGPARDTSTTPGSASNYVMPGAGGSGAYNTGAPTVFVVPGATPSAPTQPPIVGRDPGPNYTDVRTRLNVGVFNSGSAGQSPWTMMVAKPGETWEDITARMFGYADNFSKVQAGDKAKVQRVANYVRQTNSEYTGTVPDGTGPKPGSIVVYH